MTKFSELHGNILACANDIKEETEKPDGDWAIVRTNVMAILDAINEATDEMGAEDAP